MIGLIVSGTDRLADMGHNTFSHNWLRDNSISLVLTPDPGTNTQTRNYFQRNVYEIPDVAPGRRIDSANHTNLAAFQAATGQESFGVEGPVNPDELGLVWVRVDGPDVSHEPIPLFGNPATELRQCLFDDGPYFWRPGQEWNKDSYPGGWTTGTGLPPDNPYNAHAGGGVSPKSPWGGVGAFVAWPYVKPQTGMPVGWICLMAGSPPAYGFSSNGVGWWSPSLPATGGATIDIGLWMKTDEVQPLPAPAAGGAVVYVEWSDWNGQNKSRSYLVGGEPGAKAERPDLATGNLDWTELKGSVTAPDGARRMALFMGARLCTGRVYFDEIRTLAARPGRPVRWQTAGVRPDGKPLVDPGTLDFFEISLTDVVNRALADDVVDDGKSGWVNLGMPGWDLSHVGTGKTIYDGVPFTIAQPKSCLVLRSKHAQTRSRLPGSVVIPVNRRAHAVYILHAGAWLLPGIPHNFWQYRIRCANTPEALILVGAEANVRDWGADPRPFDQAAAVLPKGAWYEQQLKTTRATVPFELKGGTPAPVCGVYRLEWANPQPNQEIKEIEVRSGNSENVPIILAITGGVRK
jgi:hypothetical protein